MTWQSWGSPKQGLKSDHPHLWLVHQGKVAMGKAPISSERKWKMNTGNISFVSSLWTAEANGAPETLWQPVKVLLRNPCSEVPSTPWRGLAGCWSPDGLSDPWPGCWQSSMEGNAGGRSTVVEITLLMGQGFKKRKHQPRNIRGKTEGS